MPGQTSAMSQCGVSFRRLLTIQEGCEETQPDLSKDRLWKINRGIGKFFSHMGYSVWCPTVTIMNPSVGAQLLRKRTHDVLPDSERAVQHSCEEGYTTTPARHVLEIGPDEVTRSMLLGHRGHHDDSDEATDDNKKEAGVL